MDILIALRSIAEAREGGIEGLAKRLGMKTDDLYKILSIKGDPELTDFNKVVRGLGLRLKTEAQTVADAEVKESPKAQEQAQVSV